MSDISKKLQKLASAIYLVTGFFNEREPLKWRLRSDSADLVSDTIKDKISVMKEVNSLLTLAKNASLISDMNYEILIQEMARIEQDQENHLDNTYYRDLGIKLSPSLPKPRSIKDKNIKEVSFKKNSRQSIIIELLKNRKEAMIKDISPLIEGCSEKTVQRELIFMMRAGIVNKTGERRWSRYSLA